MDHKYKYICNSHSTVYVRNCAACLHFQETQIDKSGFCFFLYIPAKILIVSIDGQHPGLSPAWKILLYCESYFSMVTFMGIVHFTSAIIYSILYYLFINDLTN